jgi:hypothetical protein
MMINRRMLVSGGAAVILALGLPLATRAQDSFNPSVIANVYQNPASGCGYGLGYSGPGCPYGGYVCTPSGYCYYRAGTRDGLADRLAVSRQPSPKH